MKFSTLPIMLIILCLLAAASGMDTENNPDEGSSEVSFKAWNNGWVKTDRFDLDVPPGPIALRVRFDYPFDAQTFGKNFPVQLIEFEAIEGTAMWKYYQIAEFTPQSNDAVSASGIFKIPANRCGKVGKYEVRMQLPDGFIQWQEYLARNLKMQVLKFET